MRKKKNLKKLLSLVIISGLLAPALFYVNNERADASSYEAQSKLEELKKQSEENDKAIKDAEEKKKAAEEETEE